MPGCIDYLKSVEDLSNWAETLISSAAELAELLREAVQRKYALNGKMREMERYDNYLMSLKSDVISREQMTAAMVEQIHDVRMDLNNVLMSFCQVKKFHCRPNCCK